MTKKILLRTLVITAFALAALGGVAYVISTAQEFAGGCEWRYPTEPEAIEKAAGPVIEALESYRTQHGMYPASLTAAGISAESGFGPWRYERVDREARYRLVLGDYGKCLWEVSYDSRDQSWYYDH